LYLALYRKWRPQRFEDVVGQSHITETLRTQVDAGRLSHAYLFTGTRGTGKTTCAKILAKAVNCQQPVGGDPCNCCPTCRGIDDGTIMEVLEMDAASNNGVDYIRALREEAVYSPASCKKRVYIVDEVHMLSSGAFNALLKTLEEPPAHLMFILATTELHKVPATILSRCQRFSFRRITVEDIQGRLQYVADREGLRLMPDGAALLARLADGALRDGLSLLDQCAADGGTIDRESVLKTLGMVGNLRIAHLMNHIRKGHTDQALAELADLYNAGKGIASILSELSDLVRDLLIRKVAPKGGSGLMNGGYDEETLELLGKGVSAQRLVQMLNRLKETQAGLRTSANQRSDAELCLIRMCVLTLDGSLESLSARIDQLEAMLAGELPRPVPGPAREERTPQLPAESAKAPAAEDRKREADLPPWEQETAGPGAEPPVRQERPVSKPQPAPEQPRQEQPGTPASGEEGEQPAAVPVAGGESFWTGLLPLLSKKLKPWDYMPLTDKATVTGRLENETVVIYAADQFAYRTINKPQILQTVAAVASGKVGRTVNCLAKQGKPPARGTGAAGPRPGKPGKTGKQEELFQELIRKSRALGAEID